MKGEIVCIEVEEVLEAVGEESRCGIDAYMLRANLLDAVDSVCLLSVFTHYCHPTVIVVNSGNAVNQLLLHGTLQGDCVILVLRSDVISYHIEGRRRHFVDILVLVVCIVLPPR